MKQPVAFILSLFLSLAILPAKAAQLNYGKYFGTLQMDGHPELIAVSLDAFVTQGADPKAYPALDVILRVNLGGYFSSEYVGYDFHDPAFNFENGVLYLNDPKDNLIATLCVTQTDSETVLEGPVIERLSNLRGTLRVVMNLDDDVPTVADAPASDLFLSELGGEYRGKCGSQPALLQIETGRVFQPDSPGNALTGYSITGRLGFEAGPLCVAGTSGFCSIYPYASGTYSPFSNRMTLHDTRGTLDCTKIKDQLQCSVNGFYASGPCTLSKKPSVATGPVQIPTAIFMQVPSELKTPLPEPAPPGNDELIHALNGSFYGFLHHENRDQYQLIEMSIVATTSTENPHVQNRVMIEPTLLLRLGSSWDSTPLESLFITERGFYQTDGLVLESETTDTFAVIGNWRNGYVSGALYSRAYGRIGTFEMQKNSKPAVQKDMEMVASPVGNFAGPKEMTSPLQGFWSLAVSLPDDSAASNAAGAPLRARYQGTNIMNQFDAASFDLNTGFLAFFIKNPAGDRLVTGSVSPDKSLKLIWPVGPALGAPLNAYQPLTYSLSEKQEN